MSPNLPSESSRKGRFKKKMVTLDQLKTEASQVYLKMAQILELFNCKKVSDSELTALYLITLLSHRFPGTWLGAKRSKALFFEHQMKFSIEQIATFIDFEPNVLTRLKEYKSLGDIFNHFALRSTPLSVNRTLIMWSQKTYDLELMFHIPSPREVLEQQRHGRRVVSVLTKQEQLSRYILDERDALSFTMHDLIHADHFYHDNQCFQGQINFYKFLYQCMERNDFKELMKNEKFVYEFEYLISDMNAYAIHLFKCLKSAIIHYHPQKNIFFEQWLKLLNLPQNVYESLLKLNLFEYHPQRNDHIILDWLHHRSVENLQSL